MRTTEAMKEGLRAGQQDGTFTEADVVFGHAVIDAVTARCAASGLDFDTEHPLANGPEGLLRLVVLSDLTHKFFSEVVQFVDNDEVDAAFAESSISDFITKVSRD